MSGLPVIIQAHALTLAERDIAPWVRQGTAVLSQDESGEWNLSLTLWVDPRSTLLDYMESSS